MISHNSTCYRLVSCFDFFLVFSVPSCRVCDSSSEFIDCALAFSLSADKWLMTSGPKVCGCACLTF